MNKKQNLTKKVKDQLIKELQLRNQYLEQKLETIRVVLLGILDSPAPTSSREQLLINKILKDLDNKKTQEEIAKKEEVVECYKCGAEYSKSHMKFYADNLKYECSNCSI